ncbi:MAG: DUF5606 domain-containing protein [Thermonemataceae bacterium]
MELKEIAAIAGRGGLFKIIKPSRNGVIVETLDAQKKKLAISANNKVSVLKEISIYTTDKEGSVALEEVFYSIYEKYKDQLPVTSKADNDALFSLLEEVIPNYDAEKVYSSDIKKLVSWYLILLKEAPQILERKAPEEEEKEEESTANESDPEASEATPKKKKASKSKKAAEEAAKATKEAKATSKAVKGETTEVKTPKSKKK